MKKLFIIDDDPINNFISENSIKKVENDTFIKIFTNPMQAISELNALPFDPETILLLDLNMPEMNGWDVIENLENKFDTYILSSSVSAEDKDKCNGYLNIKGYISKPLTPEIGEMIINKINLFAA